MKYKTTLIYLFTVIVFFLIQGNLFSQDKWWKEKKYKNESTRMKYDLCKKTFKEIANGFLYNNINYLNPYFDNQVYLNVLSNEKGYYSSSQAELILIDFMDYFTVENFKYLRSSRFNTYAFVNGVYSYRVGTDRNNLNATISLKYYNNKWYIDQITLN
ncbi:MAG: hypothetical protein HGGPFJEG_01066 [Ignavibacteria bacterium]|nr:hypothetical protein [Ignavibacteria bacterium]